MLERVDWTIRTADRELLPLRGCCLAIAVGLHVAVAVFLLRSPPSPTLLASLPAGEAMEAILMEMAPAASPAVEPPAAEAVAEPPVVEESPAPLPVAEPIAAVAPEGDLSAPLPLLAQPAVPTLSGTKVLAARPVAARSRVRPAPSRAAAAEPIAGPDRTPALSPGAPMVAAPDGAPSWRGEVMARLLRAKRYPEGARSRGEQGTAYATFTVDRDGHVLAASLVRGSGSYQLDAEAVALIHRAEPLPPMPAEMAGAAVTLTVPVVFGLR